MQTRPNRSQVDPLKLRDLFARVPFDLKEDKHNPLLFSQLVQSACEIPHSVTALNLFTQVTNDRVRGVGLPQRGHIATPAPQYSTEPRGSAVVAHRTAGDAVQPPRQIVAIKSRQLSTHHNEN